MDKLFWVPQTPSYALYLHARGARAPPVGGGPWTTEPPASRPRQLFRKRYSACDEIPTMRQRRVSVVVRSGSYCACVPLWWRFGRRPRRTEQTPRGNGEALVYCSDARSAATSGRLILRAALAAAAQLDRSPQLSRYPQSRARSLGVRRLRFAIRSCSIVSASPRTAADSVLLLGGLQRSPRLRRDAAHCVDAFPIWRLRSGSASITAAPSLPHYW
jgi:hypothetical protein